MPARFVHATHDLMVFGRTYFHDHAWKDKPYVWLGPKHRSERHEYYQLFEVEWNWNDQFPPQWQSFIQRVRDTQNADRAEEWMSFCAHDVFDRVWDTLPLSERERLEGFYAWVALHPDVLRRYCGVDVEHGLIHRVVEGREIWEECPELVKEYEELRRYIGGVLRRKPNLRQLVASGGDSGRSNRKLKSS